MTDAFGADNPSSHELAEQLQLAVAAHKLGFTAVCVDCHCAINPDTGCGNPGHRIVTLTPVDEMTMR